MGATQPAAVSAAVARLRRVAPAVISLALFFVALEVLRGELRHVTWLELARDIVATSRLRLAAALALTVLNYAVLTTYDLLAFVYIRQAARACARGARLVCRVRGGEQRRLLDALGRLGQVPLLHALGCHGRRTVAHRLLLRDHILAGAAVGRRHQPRDEPASRGPAAFQPGRLSSPRGGCSRCSSSRISPPPGFAQRRSALSRLELPLPPPQLADRAARRVDVRLGPCRLPCSTCCCLRAVRRCSRSSARFSSRSCSDWPAMSPAAWACSKD